MNIFFINLDLEDMKHKNTFKQILNSAFSFSDTSVCSVVASQALHLWNTTNIF